MLSHLVLVTSSAMATRSGIYLVAMAAILIFSFWGFLFLEVGMREKGKKKKIGQMAKKIQVIFFRFQNFAKMPCQFGQRHVSEVNAHVGNVNGKNLTMLAIGLTLTNPSSKET